ncbi:Uncharacterised protein [Mycobacteroides abscessus subsp. bolletii]|uniref:hypothetical protein n=1 Tax=Mycobacteroides abscessus TaxID=36809 RepID=UPI00092BDA75|nr:hypothetical protein [Mycobacteroides abscessus]SHQ64280.1 Uncharacterised protein [Mycobacteroides abscessus subsp. bolletii]SHS47816.1 Uncharacterised protein [Mycobacteroides abscessus subsp. bolletii]SHT07089.1 Uncharacterised protein [Mycobacteroides abscessus subsp. bolletii]SHT14944.1 Uncharacterised protein [Mycobacteroides abscessus subsp. bolletii]SHY50438.1 Uncharacterised protein [Mycobacteroides abscessus subsp. bolletii]
MGVLINPGSHIDDATVDWTNTYEKAQANANDWLDRMRSEGLTDVVMTGDEAEQDGRWTFTFTHQVTGVSVDLEIDGIDNMDAYRHKALFAPKIYWNGSSVGEPSLDDFAADGYEPVQTFRKV